MEKAVCLLGVIMINFEESGHEWSGVMINPCHPGRIIIHTQHNKQQGITQMASSSERLHSKERN